MMLERFALGTITGLVVTVAYLGLRQLDPRVAANVLCVFGGSILSLMIVCLCAVGRRA
jgi:hypothetical protein